MKKLREAKKLLLGIEKLRALDPTALKTIAGGPCGPTRPTTRFDADNQI